MEVKLQKREFSLMVVTKRMFYAYCELFVLQVLRTLWDSLFCFSFAVNFRELLLLSSRAPKVNLEVQWMADDL